ncbi:MAG: flagellar basal body-associated FliL family protein, partial [Desulfobacterales bacterium]|nr:flagellar basal body-associated FliL family protein [Desulfobacterales bacterium]
LIIVALAFVLLLGMMGTGFFFMWNKMNAANAHSADSGETGASPAEELVKIGPIHPLDTFIVNLADEGGARYLRVTMNLELKDKDAVALVQERLPLVRNGVLMLLPAKKYADISTVEGKDALRYELVAKLNSFLKPDSVANIYFTEFVVQ